MKPSFRLLISDPAHFVALGFGAGLVPVLPGTAGSLLGLLLFLALRDLPWPVYLGLLAGVFVVGALAAHRSARLMAIKDPSCIVIDEIAGVLLALFLSPAGWVWPLVAFALFRLFDVLKPWPVGLADRRAQGGFGIMLDDLLAGGYALGGVQVLSRLIA